MCCDPPLKSLKTLQLLTLACYLLGVTFAFASSQSKGKKAYDYFCYQCHAYAGTGKTLAARYLDPPPRDFTSADPSILTRELMLQAITEGRQSTGMKSFSRVLDEATRESVVAYIRDEFMSGKPAPGRYHTRENGWPGHHEKYSSAYPFAEGEIATDTPLSQLNDNQRAGLVLFRTSCVACHDRAKVDNIGVIWRARASSYPRRHYDHRIGPVDAETSATPYHKHDKVPDVSSHKSEVQRGQQIFLDNCAFCHAADGSGKNWIGSFTEPPAADLTSARIAGWSEQTLRAVILSGVPGGTMPAWRGLLDEEQMGLLLAYLVEIVQGSGGASATDAAQAKSTTTRASDRPRWEKK